MPFPTPMPTPGLPNYMPPQRGLQDLLAALFQQAPQPQMPGALPQSSFPTPNPMATPAPGEMLNGGFTGGGMGIGNPLSNISSNVMAGIGGVPDLLSSLAGGGTPGLETALAQPPRPDPLAEGGFEAIRDRAQEMAQIVSNIPPPRATPPAGPLLHDPTRTPNEPVEPSPASTKPKGGVLLPALDLSKADRRRDALADPSARGISGAQSDGNEALEFMTKALSLPLQIPMFLRNALQKTVGSVIHGGPPGWLGQANAADEMARQDLLRADAEKQRLEAHLKSTLPAAEWARVEPQFQKLASFMSARQGGDKAKGLPGGAPPGISTKVPGVFEFFTRSYEDQGNELAQQIMEKRMQAADKRSAIKEIQDRYSTGAMSDRLGLQLDTDYARREREQGLAKGALSMDYTRKLMANVGADGGLSPSEQRIRENEAEADARRIRDERQEAAAEFNAARSGQGKYGHVKDGQVVPGNPAWRMAEIQRLGGDVPLTPPSKVPLLGWEIPGTGGDPDFENATPPAGLAAARPSSGNEAALLAKVQGMEPDAAMEMIFQAEENGQIDAATGRRLLAALGAQPAR